MTEQNPHANDALFPRLQERWVLQRHRTEAVLSLVSTTESKYRRLDPRVAIAMTFFDGTRTTRAIIDELAMVFDDTEGKVSRAFVNNILKSCSDAIDLLSERSPSPQVYPVEQFIIPMHEYEQPHQLERPLKLLIYPTGACQTNCRYCYADLVNLRARKPLSLEEWCRIFDDAKNTGIRTLELSGGDPFARPDVKEYFTEILKRGFLYFSSTKCHITYDMAKAWADAGFNQPVCGVPREFQLSVDSVDPEIADFLVGAKDYLARVESSMKNLKDAGIQPKIKAVLTPYNAGGVDALIDWAVKWGVGEVNLSLYQKSFYRHSSDLDPQREDNQRIARSIQRASELYPDLRISGDASGVPAATPAKPWQLENRLVEKWKARAGCSGGRSTLGVTPDGQGFLCEQMVMKSPFAFGDLRTQTILELWNSEELKSICFPKRSAFEGELCESCHEFEECVHTKGQCFRDNYFEFAGKIFTPTSKCPYRTA